MAGIHNELGPEVKTSLTESWIVASHRPAEHTRASNEHKLSRHLRVESVEAHKAGITLFAADCWSTVGRLLLITVLGPLLPAVGGRHLCCLFL